MNRRVSIIGGGPAGASAALSALAAGAEVDLFEKSAFPRHKVCGEFLSPELAVILDELGVWQDCRALVPARLTEVHLSIGRASKRWKLREPAHGLSRFALDRILLEAALKRGATLHRETRQRSTEPVIVAHGRYASAPAGSRFFGFKAHFEGPADDIMSLFFFDNCYVGVNAIENGRTNVCGLAPEGQLRQSAFRLDALLQQSEPLRSRISPLVRTMDWLITGPLVFGFNLECAREPQTYFAGDALGFVDPFTGSGMLGAVSTGRDAGAAAASDVSPATYTETCFRQMASQYRTAKVLRAAIKGGLAEWLLPLVPGPVLFNLTRPKVQ